MNTDASLRALHRQGSGAVPHYTMLELADRFKLMNLAFDQEDYRVDKNLEMKE